MNPVEHRDNSRAVRLALATGVVVHHARAVAYRGQLNFPWVACFLVLSGYLVLKSRESSWNSAHFFWKRFLRIWPVMIVGLALSFALLGSVEGWQNLKATFFMPKPGGYWTITLEELLYVVLAALFGLGAYRWKPTPWIGLAASAGFFLWMPQEWGWEWRYLVLLIPMFFIGNLLYLHRKRISWNGWIAVACLALDALPQLFLQGYPRYYNLLNEALLAYPLIWFALYAKPIFAGVAKIGDPSYSLFIYHWPILGALHAWKPMPFWPLFLSTYGITLALALASWHLMERRALLLKDRPPFGRISERTGSDRGLETDPHKPPRTEPAAAN